MKKMNVVPSRVGVSVESLLDSNAASKNVLILPGNMGTKQSVHEDLMLLDGDCVIR